MSKNSRLRASARNPRILEHIYIYTRILGLRAEARNLEFFPKSPVTEYSQYMISDSGSTLFLKMNISSWLNELFETSPQIDPTTFKKGSSLFGTMESFDT